MKRLFLLFMATLLVTSCSTGDIDVSYQLTTDITLSTIVSGMKDGNNAEYFDSSDTFGVTVGMYIYDLDGYLISSQTKNVTNFFKKVTFTKPVDIGSYTVVTWACIHDSNEIPIWTLSGSENLSTAKFTVRSGWNKWTHVLGVSTDSVVVEGAKDIKIDLPPVGTFVTFLYLYGDATPSTIYSEGNKRNVSYSIIDENSEMLELSGAWSEEFNVDLNYAGIYGSCFFLPTNDMLVEWKSYDSNLNLLKSDSYSLDIVEGVHNVVTTNVDTGTTTRSLASSSGSIFNIDKTKLESN